MSEKRRDNKNRILRNGESQRKDGRYAYKYTDATGKQQFVYSWKLEKTDKLPEGKRDCLSLREKEKQILRDLDDQIAPPWRGNDGFGACSEVHSPKKQVSVQIQRQAIRPL